jgi:hypothetical protein
MKRCSLCAEEIQDEAIKCKHCGAMLTGSNDPQTSIGKGGIVQIQDFKKFPVLRPDITCLECGYVGMMGQTRTKVPWILSWWILIPIILIFLASLIFGPGGVGCIVLLLICRSHFRKYFVWCPSCNRELGPIR